MGVIAYLLLIKLCVNDPNPTKIQMSYFTNLQQQNQKAFDQLDEVMQILDIKHPGYIAKNVSELKREVAELRHWRQEFLEAANSNNLSNALKKTKTAFSNEPAPPSEAELAYEAEQQARDERRIRKARTITIIDEILFDISNWSACGLVAPDLELAMKSVVFPSVIERLMQGDERYFIPEFPSSAIEVVRQGRELIREIRDEVDLIANTQKTWDLVAPRFQEWVRTEMLRLLYGAEDDAWVSDTPFTFEEMTTWNSRPASQALEFPLIFDAYELLSELTSEDRSEIGLSAFQTEQRATRIDLEFEIQSEQLSVV